MRQGVVLFVVLLIFVLFIEANNAIDHKLPWQIFPPLHYVHPTSQPAHNWPHTPFLANCRNMEDLMHKYAILHKKILDKSLPPRYIIFKTFPEYGYANRFQALLSVFTLALVSERAILLDWPETSGVALNHSNQANLKVSILHHSEILTPPVGIQWDLTPDLSAKFQNTTSVLRMKNPSSQLICDSQLRTDMTEWVEVWRTWDYFPAAVYLNPHYNDITELLKTLLPNYGGGLSRYIINFTPELKEVTEIVFEQTIKQVKSSEIILGIHIRGYHPLIVVDELMISRMVRCAMLSEADAFYVATDDIKWRNAFLKYAKLFGAKQRIMYYANTVVDRNERKGSYDAIVELNLLAACDDLMTSFGTTFGRMAVALADIQEPLVFTPEGRCMRKITPDLCFYNWDEALKGAHCLDKAKKAEPAMIYAEGGVCKML